MRCLRLLLPLLFALATSFLLQSTAPSDNRSLINRDNSVSGTKLAGLDTFQSTRDVRTSSALLSSLPPAAQGPISAALGKDDSNYWVHSTAAGFRLDNPRHALHAEFTKQGTKVHNNNLRWGLETRDYGYEDAMRLVTAVAPQAKANRVEFRRDGLTEWYENGPLGLEQGFTLAHRPGKANGQPLTLELALRGNLVASLEALGFDKKSSSLELSNKDGKMAMRYTGLQARDATGRELRSWLEVRGDRLLVRVEDGVARYPVVVDPWIQQFELTASDGGAGDSFGTSAVVSGSKIVVGAPNHKVGSNATQGAVYVFGRSDDTWVQQAELTASDGAAGDNFGSFMAISGSTIVVGARSRTVGSNQGQGAAYVFVESGGVWKQQAELTATDGGAGDNFGHSVAISGSTVVVGAPYHEVGSNVGDGAAYVFVESAGSWSQRAELLDPATQTDPQASQWFGSSVGVSGGTILIGAQGEYVDDVPEQGAAWVFVESGGKWSEQAQLTSSDGSLFDGFGGTMALSGNTAVIGAGCHPLVDGLCGPGAAYVFTQGAGIWTQQAELTPPDGAPNDLFSSSVALNGSTIVVGAPNHPATLLPTPQTGTGAVYVFVESGGTWSQQQEVIPSDGESVDHFGASVSVSGSSVWVGAPNHEVGSNSQQGAAYLLGSSGPLYTLSANPTSLALVQGQQGTSEITITPWNDFHGNVSFSASGLPSGLTAIFDPNPATGTSTLMLAASGTATTGTATVTLAGISRNLGQTTQLTLNVFLAPVVTLTRTSLDFGNVAVNNTSVAEKVALSNVGKTALAISEISASSDYAISSTTCGAALAIKKECQVSVTFTPTKPGPATGTLSFTDDALNSPQMVVLSGTGVVQAALTPSSYAFPKTKVGTTSVAHTFTLKNDLPTTLTGISYSTLGSFAISTSTCNGTLDSEKVCTIDVTFNPTQAGTATGLLTATDSANNSPQTVTLSGTSD